jgi:hypothetical protein
MPNTYVALRTVTASSQASVNFDLSGISGYTDLIIVAQAKSSVPGTTINSYRLRFNGLSTSLYSNTYMTGNGSTTSSTRDTGQAEMYVGVLPQASLNQETSIIQIMNYSNSNVFKKVITRGSSASSAVNLSVGLWRNNAAITSIELFMTSATLTGTFSLYGIASADQGTAKATGGVITEDETYWYHTFGASGAFTPKQSLTADILVVAGGGGGGGQLAQSQAASGGGGGAGGLLGFTSQSLSATNYSITVGGGGAGGVAGQNKGTNGVDSQFGALTLVKGGGGGGTNYSSNASVMTGLTGGSGGGAGGTFTGSTGVSTGGSPTTGQGNAGGNNGVTRCGGGGGGAGAVGGNALDNNIAGAGGNGVNTYSSWGLATGTGQNVSGTYWFAGGGGGGMWDTTNVTLGAGGFGGGARGNAFNVAGSNATVNTGGGGSGASASTSSSSAGGAGGSGIVIVRYLKD